MTWISPVRNVRYPGREEIIFFASTDPIHWNNFFKAPFCAFSVSAASW